MKGLFATDITHFASHSLSMTPKINVLRLTTVNITPDEKGCIVNLLHVNVGVKTCYIYHRPGNFKPRPNDERKSSAYEDMVANFRDRC